MMDVAQKNQPAPNNASLGVIKENDTGDLDNSSSSHQDGDSSSIGDSTARNGEKNGNHTNVLFSKFVVVFVLMVSAIATGTLTFILLSKDEEVDFQTNFRFVAEELAHSSFKKATAIFTAVGTMAALYPAFSHQSGVQLPRLAIEDFEAFGIGTRSIGKFDSISFCPILNTPFDVELWNQYSVNHTDWIPHGREYAQVLSSGNAEGYDHGSHRYMAMQSSNEHDEHGDDHVEIMEYVYTFSTEGRIEREDSILDLPYAPVWQTSPVPENTDLINFNLASISQFAHHLSVMIELNEPILSEPSTVDLILGPIAPEENHSPTPHSIILHPVYDNFPHEGAQRVVGVLVTLLEWEIFFADLLQEGQNGIVIVLESCGHNVTFAVNGNVATYVGDGDSHDSKYDMLEVLASSIVVGRETQSDQCMHAVHIFPSDDLKASYETSKPLHYALIVVGIFFFSALVFLVYDYIVTTRHRKTTQKANKSAAILQELFPGRLVAQLFEVDSKKKGEQNEFGEQIDAGPADGPSIADFYPEATVLFADIAGFTAWSSIREPQSVFILLESIFHGFDTLAKINGVFKVETIGDCYVAVAGVPRKRKDHALVMARFARDAMDKFSEVVRDLELRLGPDTADLAMRFGIHSGPVTAGVLRGERARFQLFGDTMNTASRIETNGQRERIHLSEQTAAELVKYGKEDWIIPRHDMIEAKGKGKLKTFWLKLNSEAGVASSTVSSSYDNSERADTVSDAEEVLKKIKNTRFSAAARKAEKLEQKKAAEKASIRNQRLSDWNSELLLRLLKKVVARQHLMEGESASEPNRHLATLARSMGTKGMVVDEVAEVIQLPTVKRTEYGEVELSEDVEKQVRLYVNEIASLYNAENPFHNWEHASHVTMSVSKLLARIIVPTTNSEQSLESGSQDELLHDNTYGITSDPLTHFACVFSALIHDVGHTGVPNGQLSKENEALNKLYKGKSLAEQNSVDVAWTVLMKPEYDKFRDCIFRSVASLKRFRSLLVNSVMATDIFDKDLKDARNARWEKAFDDPVNINGDDYKGKIYRKATIVIEHIIQASDVSHVMQHWHVYRKWNERLFTEMYKAFRKGRSDKCPSESWYKGELWFFDNYIIPLAKKLAYCKVFGTASDEYLNYAKDNRRRWEQEGEAATADMLEKLKKQFEDEDAANAQEFEQEIVCNEQRGENDKMKPRETEITMVEI